MKCVERQTLLVAPIGLPMTAKKHRVESQGSHSGYEKDVYIKAEHTRIHLTITISLLLPILCPICITGLGFRKVLGIRYGWGRHT